jgi:hypothetical protein
MDPTTLDDILANKMIRPTTIPQTLEELIIEHAVAREALRLGLNHHKFLARGLRGAIPAKLLEDTFGDASLLASYIDLLKVDLMGGTGGLLSHAPRRVQSSLMLIDGFQPEGVTRLIQDSVFMFPHLGVLSTVYPEIAYEVFDKDAVIRLGTCIAPKGRPENEGDEMLSIELHMPDGSVRTENLVFGDMIRIPLPVGEVIDIKVNPHKQCDMGAGPGHELTTRVEGGEVGLIIDARGRPLITPTDKETMKRNLLKWLTNLNAYPPEDLKKFAEMSD